LDVIGEGSGALDHVGMTTGGGVLVFHMAGSGQIAGKGTRNVLEVGGDLSEPDNRGEVQQEEGLGFPVLWKKGEQEEALERGKNDSFLRMSVLGARLECNYYRISL